MIRVFAAIIITSMLPFAALSIQSGGGSDPAAIAADDMLRGCGDVPEVVALIEEYRLRETRIAKALAALRDERAEVSEARAVLAVELKRLKSAKKRAGGSLTNREKAVESDIERLVAVYEAMKPKEAAAVLSDIPAEFSAELLMRVHPETSARIISALEPEKAAILTTYMGARSASSE
ncbi:MotE family protein [Paracoccus sediminicola]|uniref:MotE family protein n=1 Tax=Paracoccus sediminicola TaxID=3017783 RepID=UPI0022EFE87D|nr:hypothetical protein [Paracoccus sediminicola]WBU56728.1 hypothetical protein PAF18_14840 [Paracoccus sediminicola]